MFDAVNIEYAFRSLFLVEDSEGTSLTPTCFDGEAPAPKLRAQSGE
jgi:hypothetical protein